MENLQEPVVDYDDESDDWIEDDQQMKDSKAKIVSNLFPIDEKREVNIDKSGKDEQVFIEIKEIEGKDEEKAENKNESNDGIPEVVIQNNTKEDNSDEKKSNNQLNLHENVDLLNSIAKMINGKRRSFKVNMINA